MATGKARPADEPAEEPADLARFRAEWKAELESRKRARQAEQPLPSAAHAPALAVRSPGPSTSTTTTSIDPLRIHYLSKPSKPGPALGGSHPAITPDGRVVEQKQPRALTSALSIYRQAVLHEQAGELDEALSLYRQAFRMDSHVDRAFHREEMLLSIATQQAGNKVPSSFVASTLDTISPMTQTLAAEKSDDVTRSFQALSIKPQDSKPGKLAGNDALRALVVTFIDEEPSLKFKPEDETQPVAVNILPEEILVEIIHLLDFASIECFALVCKKSRILTLESSIWRNLVIETYKEPQIPDMESLARIVHSYGVDYRRVFIEQPRVRMDGAYIAICHYIRQGLSDNHWVNISHLITYHRYLRFYPNGQVLSLLANEEHPPQTIINMLKPSLRMKGLYIGTWSLSGSTVVLSNLFDASGRFHVPEMIEEPQLTSHPPGHHSHPNHYRDNSEVKTRQPSRYVFVMSLNLKSRPLGRWNRLDIQSYDTLNTETGDVTPVALKHERPFWFSKVRSYA